MDFAQLQDEVTRLKDIAQVETDQFQGTTQLSGKELSATLVDAIEIKRKQQSTIRSQIKEHEVITKKLLQMQKDFENAVDINEKLTQEVVTTQKEIKHSKKPLKATIKKYSENFGMDIKIKETLTDQIVASIPFSENITVDVRMDKSTLGIIEWNSSSLQHELGDNFNKSKISDNDPNIWIGQIKSLLHSQNC